MKEMNMHFSETKPLGIKKGFRKQKYRKTFVFLLCLYHPSNALLTIFFFDIANAASTDFTPATISAAYAVCHRGEASIVAAYPLLAYFVLLSN